MARPAISTASGDTANDNDDEAAASAPASSFFFFFFLSVTDDEEEEAEVDRSSRHCSTGSRLTLTDLGLPVAGSANTATGGD